MASSSRSRPRSAFTGINFGITESIPFYKMPPALVAFGDQHIGAFPYLLVAPLIVAALLGLFFSRTVPGRQLLAYGGNPQAAELSGIPRERTVVLAHVISGTLAAIAAVLAVAQLGSAQPTIGADWLLLSFAAPIIGGAALTGGYISVLGTMFAVVADRPYRKRHGAGEGRSLLGAVPVGRAHPRRRRPQPLARHQVGDRLMHLSIESVSKSFPGVRALDGVSLDLKAGEIHALMGENGAGKSTLIKIITGVHRPDAGRVLLDGKPVEFRDPRAALAAGIGAVHQERNLIPRFSVGENILLERLPTKGGLVDYDTINREARRFLDLLDRGIDTRVEVRTLSVAQMQIVEIAKALSLEAKILLLDEPTASITDHETAALFAVLQKLRADGVAIVFVSHKLDEVFALADRVTVLRDGKVAAANQPLSAMSRQRLVTLMIGREERVANLKARAPSTAEVVLQTRGLSTSMGHHGIDLVLRKGEILGLYGLVGAGRSELAHAILGGGDITGGEIRHPRRAGPHPGHARGAAPPPDRLRQRRPKAGGADPHALGPRQYRDHDLASPCRSARPDRADAPSRARFCRSLTGSTCARRRSLSRSATLSGGNQQKVSIAKWLAANTEILIIDEPTVGIDIKTKTDLHELIGEIAAGGVSVLLISSDMPEMITLADRILVMHGFRIVGEVENDHRYETTSTAIMSHIHAVEPDAAGAP